MDSSGQGNHTFNIFDVQYPLPLEKDGSKTKGHILMTATILFAQQGYAAVSIRDIAKATGLKPASLYNYFDGKEALWAAVLEHTKGLYILYFQQLGEQVALVKSFEEVLEVLLAEPKKMENVFTCYAFALVQAEQFRDAEAADIVNGTFLSYSIQFIQRCFDECVARGLVSSFDTKMVAAFFMHNILTSINVSVQKLLGRPIPYEPREILEQMQQFILRLVGH